VRESLLDDIPGVSETRKKALLAEFGSVERIRKLTPESLANVPGISLRLAEQITTYLASRKAGGQRNLPDPA
jgi:excinuclease ABC subunit C